MKRGEIENIQRRLGRYQKILYAIKDSRLANEKKYWLAFGWLDNTQKNSVGNENQNEKAYIQVQGFYRSMSAYLLLASGESQNNKDRLFFPSTVKLEMVFKNRFSDNSTEVVKDSGKTLHDRLIPQTWELSADFQRHTAITHDLERKLMYERHNSLIMFFFSPCN